MLYLIGIGLSDGDISLKAIDAMKRCSKLYCEQYTGEWLGSMEELEKIAGKGINVLRREQAESDFLINESEDADIALLVTGDSLAATTHFELVSACRKHGIGAEIIHAPSIYTAVAESGLQLYKFGRTTTLVNNSDAASPFDVIRQNMGAGMHTLVLLDIGMTASQAAKLLQRIALPEKIVACIRLGSREQRIVYDSAENIAKSGASPAALIVPGKLNFKEEEFLEMLK